MGMSNKKPKQEIIPASIAHRAEWYMADNELLLKKHGLTSRPIIYFPKCFSKTPLLSRIAIRIVAIQGGVLDTQFNDIKKTN